MELPIRHILTIEVARRIADVAKAYARDKGHPNLVVVIVDSGGHLLYFERGDGVAWGTIDVAVAKPQTSARFNRPSKYYEERLAGGLVGLVALPGMACFDGAVPLRTPDGELLGAIAISGLTKELDGEIAGKGADELLQLLAPPEKPVRESRRCGLNVGQLR